MVLLHYTRHKGAKKMAVDLKGMTLKQLQKLAEDVAKEVTKRASKERDAAMKAAAKAAKQHGFDLADLLGDAPKKPGRKKAAAKKAPLPAKYKNPKDANQTWSGRGRQPEWYKAAIAAGKTPKSLEI
ncbi:MAG: H-NS histone family protein [Pseudomonadota bacterium]